MRTAAIGYNIIVGIGMGMLCLVVLGWVQGEVLQISPDASEAPAKSDKHNPGSDNAAQNGFRTIVSLKAPYLERDGAKYQLNPGMQVSAEINLGSRTVLE